MDSSKDEQIDRAVSWFVWACSGERAAHHLQNKAKSSCAQHWTYHTIPHEEVEDVLHSTLPVQGHAGNIPHHWPRAWMLLPGTNPRHLQIITAQTWPSDRSHGWAERLPWILRRSVQQRKNIHYSGTNPPVWAAASPVRENGSVEGEGTELSGMVGLDAKLEGSEESAALCGMSWFIYMIVNK